MIKDINTVIRFLVELGTVILLIASGWRGGLLSKLLLGLLFPLLLMVFWSHYMAPMAPARLTEGYRGLVEIIIFGSTAVIIGRAFNWPAGVVYAAIAGINAVLDHWL
ncbi:DUF2568 domain-containing protein [Schleiferilactobacillus shenzhenensis]|uniref:Uncharacterized protein n=1 Tax=Schleiferilactobacillus shenzhenensis LY-73 TaxID=1231336 RepID=U4TM57_9LACO|nr:DUF2568 domain-containing protein [Schleiferilactobacillus shenzhenensis]ERL65951.1 hypothetical protein L248_2027 [Schleiferilactobacillus shenzhenensis LY-73]